MLELFVVKSKDGKYFHRKTYGGNGNGSWFDDLKKARLYTAAGPAKTVASWWANEYPQYGAPDVVKLTVTQEEVIVSDLKTIQLRKLKRELKDVTRRIQYYEKNHPNWDVDSYQTEAREIRRKIADLETRP